MTSPLMPENRGQRLVYFELLRVAVGDRYYRSRVSIAVVFQASSSRKKNSNRNMRSVVGFEHFNLIKVLDQEALEICLLYPFCIGDRD